MSEMIYKTVLRFPLPQYGGWGVECVLESIETIVKDLPKLDIDELCDEDDCEEHCFGWAFHNGKIRLVSDWHTCTYAIDYILCEGGELNYTGHCIHFGAIQQSVFQLCNMFDVFQPSVHLHIYRWYNGSDEPIHMNY